MICSHISFLALLAGTLHAAKLEETAFSSSTPMENSCTTPRSLQNQGPQQHIADTLARYLLSRKTHTAVEFSHCGLYQYIGSIISQFVHPSFINQLLGSFHHATTNRSNLSPQSLSPQTSFSIKTDIVSPKVHAVDVSEATYPIKAPPTAPPPTYAPAAATYDPSSTSPTSTTPSTSATIALPTGSISLEALKEAMGKSPTPSSLTTRTYPLPSDTSSGTPAAAW